MLCLALGYIPLIVFKEKNGVKKGAEMYRLVRQMLYVYTWLLYTFAVWTTAAMWEHNKMNSSIVIVRFSVARTNVSGVPSRSVSETNAESGKSSESSAAEKCISPNICPFLHMGISMRWLFVGLCCRTDHSQKGPTNRYLLLRKTRSRLAASHQSLRLRRMVSLYRPCPLTG